ncbi:MAG: hypothetical protein E6R08_01135 [Nevskiaceae bacterium]|nr:MAG: hypothetical protein E6R08_01135 [Nevskiaceae bacterium]
MNSTIQDATSAIEAAGFEALQRLYSEAVENERDVGSVCARLLLGLYHGRRFPFDLSDLRLLPPDLYRDAAAAIELDARVKRQEVHLYFVDGGTKFEKLAVDYQVVDRRRR